MIENFADMISLHDPDGTIRYVSQASRTLLGREPGELIGRSPYEFIHPDDAPAVKMFHESLRRTVSRYVGTYRARRDDGTYIWLETSFFSLRDQKTGDVIEIQSLSRDITARRAAEQITQSGLKESRDRERVLLSAIPDLMFRFDLTGHFIDFAADQIDDLIAPSDVFLGKHYREVLPAEIADQLESAIESARETGKLQKFEYDICHKTGKTRTYEARLTASKEGGCVLICRDMTELRRVEEELRRELAQRKHTEEMLRHANSYNRSLIEANLTPMLMIGLDGKITDVNRAAEDVVGYSRTDLIGQEFFNYCSDSARARQGFNDVLRESALRGFSLDMMHRDGHFTSILCNASLFKDDRGSTIGVCVTGHDVTERQRMETALRESEQRFRGMADTVPDILFTCNPDGWCDFVNRRFYEYSGRDPESAEGFGYSQSIHPDDFEADQKIWRRSLETGENYQNEYRLRAVDNSYHWFVDRAHPIRDASGKIIKWFGAATDINDLKLAQQALQSAKSSAEEANEAKSRFLANISHELRTPLGAILGLTDLSLDEELRPSVREYLKTAKEAGESLLDLLNEILDLSRMEAGKIALVDSPFNLRETLDSTLKALAVRAHEKDLEVFSDIPIDIPDELTGDSRRLRQILTNLVGNAIKFTHHGEIIVRARIDAHHTDGISLQFSVQDTGIGIKDVDREKIFAPFEQADMSTTRPYGGTGLGLAISRNLIQLMGGRIWFESEANKGTTFHFTVNLGCTKTYNAWEREAFPELTRFRDLPVIIVNNNMTGRRLIESTLKRWQMHVASVEWMDDVPRMIKDIKTARKTSPILIVDARQLEFEKIASTLLQNGLKSEVHAIILMVSRADCLAEIQKASQLDAIFADKPISDSVLYQAFNRSLQKKGPETTSLLKEQRHQTSTIPDTPLNILVAEDNPINQLVIVNMLKREGHIVEIANDGWEAVERVSRQRFDMVLMDIQMPTMDGFEATVAIRALTNAAAAKMPIIALTAHAMTGDKERCIAAGMNGFISKPIDKSSLKRIIAQFKNHRLAM